MAVMYDLQAIFRQVKVAEEDRDFLCFLWWPEGDLSKEVVEFHMDVKGALKGLKVFGCS